MKYKVYRIDSVVRYTYVYSTQYRCISIMCVESSKVKQGKSKAKVAQQPRRRWGFGSIG